MYDYIGTKIMGYVIKNIGNRCFNIILRKIIIFG